MRQSSARRDSNEGKPETMRGRSELFLASAAALLIAVPVASWAQTFTNIVDPNDTTGDTVSSGINDSGQVVGSYFNTTSGGFVGFSLSGGAYSDVVVSGSAATVASGVNNAGLITGTSTDGSGGNHGFTWSGYSASGGALTGGTQTSFDNINASSGSTFGSATNSSGTTVGYFFDTNGQHGFSGPVTPTYNPTTLDDPSGTGTAASDVNSSGKIVGSFFNGAIEQGFAYNGSTYATISDPLGVGGTDVTGIDDAGDVVGYYIDGGGTTHGFIEYASDPGVFVTIDDPSSGSATDASGSSTEVLGINDLGYIVGSYVTTTGATIGFEEDLPEPATIGLFTLGVLGLGALRRRRNNAA
jgi:hypothetical protein